jgi:hypothetical protein
MGARYLKVLIYKIIENNKIFQLALRTFRKERRYIIFVPDPLISVHVTILFEENFIRIRTSGEKWRDTVRYVPGYLTSVTLAKIRLLT